MTTVTRNLLVDHFRKTKNDRITDSIDAPIGSEDEGHALSEKIEDKGLTPDQHVQKQQTQKMVQEALQKLSPELREAVILRDLQDMDYREIAQALEGTRGYGEVENKSGPNGTGKAIATYI